MILNLVLGVILGIIYASFFEWALHKYVMHKPIKGLTYSFKKHTLTHHRIFKADKTYHLINEKDKWTIPMRYWNGPLLIFVGQLPFAIMAILFHTWIFWISLIMTLVLYYGIYEYIHWCFHLPKKRFIGRFWIFHFLDNHHLLHHRYMGRNFNVVFPLADLVLGTLILKDRRI